MSGIFVCLLCDTIEMLDRIPVGRLIRLTNDVVVALKFWKVLLLLSWLKGSFRSFIRCRCAIFQAMK